ncbi:hypothetical protein pdul_cds_1036 [Pandoravirus dulcis]|uniref:Uncharacterized protein n=1 Tax=Pandoravirus dulcis TaxID=1349409 RepID=S4VZM7_9VIRU|nr:hypothetical protein pdul_cds_1036 [Pandoravirus dulcis]AGO83309.1 hypothetical protein pdul_cds_1036 [Pandoravirus dulcis]
MDSALDSDVPTLDVLPDEILDYIVAEHVLDPKDLGACLLAWRRFHVVLGSARLIARRCRYSTLLSLCAAGDTDGLRHVAARPETFGPVPGFRWDACLYAAAVGDHVDALDHLKARIVEVAATLPPAPCLNPDPPDDMHAHELMAIRSLAQGKRIDVPTWPPSPASWLAIAVAAAHRGCDRALAWLCADGNRPERVVTLRCVLSAYARIWTCSNDMLLWVRMRLDLGVVLANRRAAHAMDEDAMRAIAERVSAVSGLDIVDLFQRSMEHIRADRQGTRSSSDALRAYIEKAQGVESVDKELVHRAMADPSHASSDAVEAAWLMVARGDLTALRSQYGDETVAATLNRATDYYMRMLSIFVPIASCLDASPTDVMACDTVWSPLCDDVVWLYKRAPTDQNFLPAYGPYIKQMLCAMMILGGRCDLAAQFDRDTVMPTTSAPLPNYIAYMYAHATAVCVGRGDLDTARWACARMGPGSTHAAWDVWQSNADAARFLYAHGCERAPRASVLDGEFAESPLYVSLRARDTEAVGALLDPTAADDSYREAVDRAISAAVTRAADEALAAGNQRVVVWLHRRYPDLVDALLEEARTTRTPSLIPIRARAPRT